MHDLAMHRLIYLGVELTGEPESVVRMDVCIA